MAKGQSNEISFVVCLFVFIGAIVYLVSLIPSSDSGNIIGTTTLNTPPTPPSAGDILGMASYVISLLGYMITSIFGLSSSYALITGILLIPCIMGIAWLVAKLIRGTG